MNFRIRLRARSKPVGVVWYSIEFRPAMLNGQLVPLL
jgi:hypothetical protein